MLPVILSAQLNDGQSQPRNELMYQCQNLLRTITSKWVMLIFSISLCPHIEFALSQRNGCGLSLHGIKHFNGKSTEPFLHCTEAKNWYVRVPKRGCHDNFDIFWKNKCLQSYWHLHKMLQKMWSLISKITFLWKANQNIVTVNTGAVDQSIYARNPMLPNTLTVSRTIIHETQNLLYCFLPEVLIM